MISYSYTLSIQLLKLLSSAITEKKNLFLIYLLFLQHTAQHSINIDHHRTAICSWNTLFHSLFPPDILVCKIIKPRVSHGLVDLRSVTTVKGNVHHTEAEMSKWRLNDLRASDRKLFFLLEGAITFVLIEQLVFLVLIEGFVSFK